MNPVIAHVNAFLEDLCVITVVAYLLARSPLLTLLFQKRLTNRQILRLGSVLGLVAMTGSIFPEARYPFVIGTLIATFATMTGGVWVGVTTAAIASAGSWLLDSPTVLIRRAVTLFASVLVTTLLSRAFGNRFGLLRGMITGLCSEGGAVLLRAALAHLLHLPYPLSRGGWSVVANGSGVALLQLVVNEALSRAEGERHRVEAERARALVASAELAALRSRVHPHFLFNALTALASLCSIDAREAENGILCLSLIMRRLLHAPAAASLPLTEEIEHVRAYLKIQGYRYGQRLRVEWDVDESCFALNVPEFMLQILVENAVNHGIANKTAPGTVCIRVRRRRGQVLIVVADDGVGISADRRRTVGKPQGSAGHGLSILAQQLRLLHGNASRLILLSHADVGTLACVVMSAPEKTPPRQDRSVEAR